MGGETAALPPDAEEWLNCADAVDKVVRTRQCGEAAAKLWMRDCVRSREIRVKASSDFLKLHPAYHKKISENANSGRPWDSDLPEEIDLASDFDVDPFIMDQPSIELGSLWHAGDLRAALAREVAAAAEPGAPPQGQDRKTPGPKPKWDRFGVAAEVAWRDAQQCARGEPWTRKQLADEVKKVAEEWSQAVPKPTAAAEVADGILRARERRRNAVGPDRNSKLRQ